VVDSWPRLTAPRAALREAVVRSGGYRISDGFISPLDLIEIGLVSAEEAQELHAMETVASHSSDTG
jgi:hypothetical protein